VTYIEYEASNIYTASAFQTRAKECYFHSFHYISAWAETIIAISASLFVGELVCRRVGCRRVGLSASCP